MFSKKILPALCLAVSAHGALFGFTIINQTDTERVVQIQEAYRPESKTSGTLATPVPFFESPNEMTIPPHSVHTFSLRKSCPVVLVSLVTTEVVQECDNEKCESDECDCEKSDHELVHTRTTCYGSYNYRGRIEPDITDEWGIVIHKPILNQKPAFFLDPDYFLKSYLAKQNLEQGYGIKCLHPALLEKVSSLEELPEELTN